MTVRLWMAVIFLALTGPSLAAPPVEYTGTAEVFFGVGRNFADDSDVHDASPFLKGVKAEAFVPISGNLVGQFDFAFEHGTGVIADSTDEDYHFFGGGAHIGFMAASRYRLGGVFGVMGGDVVGEEEQSYWLLGAEGRFEFDRTSAWGQAGYFDAISECHACYQNWWHEVSYVRGGANYFIEDDLKLAFELGYFDGYVEGQDQAPLRLLSAGLEHRCLEQMSVFASYRNSYFANEDEDDPFTQHALFVGLRVQWGAGQTVTLRENDRYRSLGLPDVGQFIAVSEDFD